MIRLSVLVPILFLLGPIVAYASAPEPTKVKVRVGAFHNPPRVFNDSDHRPSGFFPDVLRAIAEENDWELEWLDDSWPELKKALEEGRIDLLLDVAHSKDRESSMNFNGTIVLRNWSTFLHSTSLGEIKSLKDLEGKRIAVLIGSVESAELQRQLKSLGISADFLPSRGFRRSLGAVVEQKADVALVSRTVANWYRRDYSELAQSKVVFLPTRLHIVASDRAKHLIPLIDESLEAMKEEGDSAYHSAYSRWISEQSNWVAIALRQVGPWIVVIVAFVIAVILTFQWMLKQRTLELKLKVAEVEELNRSLKENEGRLKRYEFTLEQIPEIIWTAGPTGGILFCNSYTSQYTGQSLKELEGTGWKTVIHPDDFARVDEHWKQSVRTKSFYRVEHRIFHAQDGTWNWNLCQATPMLSENGDVIEWIGISMDIDRMRRYQDEIIEARDSAESANRAKTQFLAVMNHELRTPLNAIIGSTDILVEEFKGTESEALLKLVLNAGNHLLSLVSDILDLSRIEAGEERFDATPTVLAPFLEDRLSELKQRATDKGLSFDVSIDPSVPEVLNLDQRILFQILDNLIGNAIKFTESGSVDLLIRWDDRFSEICRGSLVFDVRDTGPGVPEAFQEKIFEPFQQVDMSSRREHGGTGLGLAICKRLATALSGSIRLIESSPDSGTSLRVSLPLERVEVVEVDREPVKEIVDEAASGDFKMLLVEDDLRNIEVFKLILDRLGYDFDLVETGEDAVTAAEKGIYDLILMDVGLPGMDGMQATRNIRALDLEDRPMIVALTAHALEDTRRACLEAGMDDFLSKPVRVGGLKKVLDRVGLAVNSS